MRAKMAVAKITRSDLIVDAIGIPPSVRAAAEVFYRPIDAAYEHRSVIVASNLHPDDFDSLIPKTLAAAVDRLLQLAHLVLTKGSSLRLIRPKQPGCHPADRARLNSAPDSVNA